MQKFRKKPVVIEAIQWDGTGDTFSHLLDEGMDGTFAHHEGLLCISTPEGLLTAHEGDWIIKGIKGEFYPVKPGIFEQTYEKMEESDD